MKVFISRDQNGYINAYHTSTEFTAFEDAEQETPTVDITKLQGYKIEEGKLVFDEALYSQYISEKQAETAIEEGNKMVEELAVQNVLFTADDAASYTMRYLYPEWDPEGVQYFKDKWPNRVMRNNKFYKVEQDHISQESWTPEEAPSLFTEISDPNEEWPEFKQPTHAENAYMKDDKITYNGKHYQSNIDNNVWSPDDYPTGWRLVEG